MNQVIACLTRNIPSTRNLMMKIILFFSAMAVMHGANGQTQEKIDSLLNVIKGAGEDTTLVMNLKSISCFYSDISNFEMAMQYGDSALVLAEKLGFQKGKAHAHLCIGRVYFYKGDFERSMQHSNIARNINEEIGDKNGLARACLNIGIAFMMLGNYAEALKNSTNALEISKETGDQKIITTAYLTISGIFSKQGNYPEALKNYLELLKIAEKSGIKKDLANAYNDIGSIYFGMNNFQEALHYALASLKIAEELEDKWLMTKSYNNIGILMSELGDHEKALEYYLAALKINRETGNKAGIAINNNQIGTLKADLGDYQAAKEYLLTALKINEETGSKSGIALSNGQLGKVNIYLSDFTSARQHLENGLKLSKSIGDKSTIGFIYRFLYKLDSAEGKFSRALENYKLYALYSDSLMGEESKQQVERMKIEYETEKKDKEIELLNKDNEIKSLQLSRQKAVRHGMIAGIVLLFVTGFLLFRSFRLRKKLEQQQAIIGERKRISADLHDDVGSGLSRIMLLTELVKNEAKTPEMQKEAEKIASISKDLSANISEIIWALNANNDYLESLIAYIRRYAAEFFDESAVKLSIKSTGKISGIPISGELRREIFYTVKEALHNIYKHAKATEAVLNFSIDNEVLTVAIQDNGIGMPEKDSGHYGNGLNNMQQRMRAAGGNIKIENHEGTRITLEVPVR